MPSYIPMPDAVLYFQEALNCLHALQWQPAWQPEQDRMKWESLKPLIRTPDNLAVQHLHITALESGDMHALWEELHRRQGDVPDLPITKSCYNCDDDVDFEYGKTKCREGSWLCHACATQATESSGEVEHNRQMKFYAFGVTERMMSWHDDHADIARPLELVSVWRRVVLAWAGGIPFGGSEKLTVSQIKNATTGLKEI